MASFLYIPEVASGGFLLQGTPTITGTRIVGQTLICNITTVTPNPLPGGATSSFQWRRNGVNISGATTSTYVLQSADAGQNISCVYSATLGPDTSYVITPAVAILETLFDMLPTQAAHGWATKLLRGAYFGSPLFEIQNSVGILLNILPGSDGLPEFPTGSTWSIFHGGNPVTIRTVYDQLGGAHFTQPNAADQYRIWTGTAFEALGGDLCFNNITTDFMTVPSSGSSGTFNFLHDGTTEYTVYMVETAVVANVFVLSTNNNGTTIGANIGYNTSNRLQHAVYTGSATVVSASTSINTTVTGTQSLLTYAASLNNAIAARKSFMSANGYGSMLNTQTPTPVTGNSSDLRWNFVTSNQKQAVIIYKTMSNRNEIQAAIRNLYPNLKTIF